MAAPISPLALTMSRGLDLAQHFSSSLPHRLPLPDFDPTKTTVGDLKNIIAHITGLEAQGQILYSGPLALVNNHLLSEYKDLASRPIRVEPALMGGCFETSCTESCCGVGCTESCCC